MIKLLCSEISLAIFKIVCREEAIFKGLKRRKEDSGFEHDGSSAGEQGWLHLSYIWKLQHIDRQRKPAKNVLFRTIAV